MNLIRTVKIKLETPTETFLPTINAFTKAYNLVCETGWNDKDFNGVSLHNKTYKITREYLPSQLACSARTKATETLSSLTKAIKKRTKLIKRIEELKKKNPNKFYKIPKEIRCPESKQSSIRYDARSYNIWFDKNEISLLTTEGRKRLPVFIPEYFKQYISWKRCSADLFIKDNKIYLHIVFSKDVPDLIDNKNNYIGIDRGVKKLVVSSNNMFFGGGHIKQIHRKYDKLRSELRSAADRNGNRSVKRHLKRISHKANRFSKDANHCISKQIVNSLPTGSTIVLEDLTGIRDRCKQHKKKRKDFNRWSFFQLEQFLTYKAASKGVSVVHVDARYTSQRCSKCGHIERSNRKSQSCFKCKNCGFQLNADLNASRNIVCKHLDATGYPGQVNVNLPNSSLLLTTNVPRLSVEQIPLL
jgi:putative transposase